MERLTEHEAIKDIQRQLLEINSEEADITLSTESLSMAINALEKQIPKKILYRKQSYGTPWLCPICEADQIKVEFMREDGYEPQEKYSYCWKCGQRIDWETEKALEDMKGKV